MAELRSLARPGGGFAMLALDQRVSLANIFVAAGLDPAEDALDWFRTAAATALAPEASAILLDPGYVTRSASSRPWTGGGALIVAADDLEQAPGQPASGSRLDRDAADVAIAQGAAALKLLVVWIAGDGRDAEHDAVARLVADFISLAHDRSLLAIVEGIVRPDPASGERHAPADELLRAASILSAGADLYKAQVPVHRGEVPADVERLSRELSATVPCPWVVLSTGVAPARFAELLAAACRGGASGFLAGRAIWASAVGSPDPEAHLAGEATTRFRELTALVDADARPWDAAPLPPLSMHPHAA